MSQQNMSAHEISLVDTYFLFKNMGIKGVFWFWIILIINKTNNTLISCNLYINFYRTYKIVKISRPDTNNGI